MLFLILQARELYVQFPRLAGARLAGAVVDKACLIAQLRQYADADALVANRVTYLEKGITGLD